MGASWSPPECSGTFDSILALRALAICELILTLEFLAILDWARTSLPCPFVHGAELDDERYGIPNPGGNSSSELGPRAVAGGVGAGGPPELDGPG